MHAVHQQPVVLSEMFQTSSGIAVVDPFGDVNVHPDAKIAGQPGRVREKFVGARERRMHTDHSTSTGSEEPFVLRQAAPTSLDSVTFGDSVSTVAPHSDGVTGTSNDVE